MVLIACGSAREREQVESSLKRAGLVTLTVDGAEGVRMRTAMEFFAEGTPCVLVVDEVLLGRDALRWRRLRERHPGLGTIVLSGERGDGELPGPGGDGTRFVHCDDPDGLCRAVRELAAAVPGPRELASSSVALRDAGGPDDPG